MRYLLFSLTLFICQILPAQETTIYQSELPYTIPIIMQPSEGPLIEYQWAQNGSDIPGATALNYTIPDTTQAGIYNYVLKIRCAGCTDWLSSNNFKVRILTGKTFKGLQVGQNMDPTKAIFSPQRELSGYLDYLISLINNSQESIDIALYTFESFEIYFALQKAAARGVRIRILYEGAKEDLELENSVSKQLEDVGADVRYVNKIIHHKYLISDNQYIITSSGNWNDRANGVYDENTLLLNQNEVVLRYRAEFEKMWNFSREFGEARQWPYINSDSLLSLINDDPNVDVLFTSANFRTYISSRYGPTFALNSGSQEVAFRIAELISQAQSSIKIAANHLRSRPIAEAILQKRTDNPSIEIKVFLDQQEYVSESYNNYQKAAREECLNNANTEGEIRDCQEKNFYYSYELVDAGIEVRFKTYSNLWDHSTAELMHHKYAIIDDSLLATGSYNYSYNAETNSMENVVLLHREANPEIIDSYINNFSQIWNTGREEDYLSDLLSYIQSESKYVPALYIPMSLDYQELFQLKNLVFSKCPELADTYFKDAKDYLANYIQGLSYEYDTNNNIHKVVDSERMISTEFTYDDNSNLVSTNLLMNDSVLLKETISYNNDGTIEKLYRRGQEINFGYIEGKLSSLEVGQGIHSWITETRPDGVYTIYSTPSVNDYLAVKWDTMNRPILQIDGEGKSIQYSYTDLDLSSIHTSNREINFSFEDQHRRYTASSSDGEVIAFSQPTINELNINLHGTIESTLHYNWEEESSSLTNMNIEIISDNVSFGRGRIANINYEIDAYGRVIGADDLKITRLPYSGKIKTIDNNQIHEIRAYNEWELLKEKEIFWEDILLYKTVYEYDALDRIVSLTEIIREDTIVYRYLYDSLENLAKVYEGDLLVEEYLYDLNGNRTNTDVWGVQYEYEHNGANQLNRVTWEENGNTRLTEHAYNRSGQLVSEINKSIYNSYPQITSQRDYSYNVFDNLDSIRWASQLRCFKYDAYDRQIATFHNGKVQRKLIFGFGAMPLAELNENDRIINTFIYADEYAPILMRKGNTDYYLISDHRNSVCMVVKVNSGDVRQLIRYDSYGNVIEDSNPGYTPFGFAAGLYDYRTELVRFGARDYLPKIGKWTSDDPLGFFSTDLNFYSYVGNDPINYVDPNGLSKSPACAGGVGMVGPYDELQGTVPGLQAHHVGQKAVMARLIPNYNWRKAPSILVPAKGHTRGAGVLARGTKGFTNARSLLARDIRELRRVYPNLPNRSLQKLIELNKKTYPKAFSKCP